MPDILPPGFRRLLSAFAYAVDGVELGYCRLREAALTYNLPAGDAPADDRNFAPRSRLGLLMDAWSMIDHVSRARKLISRFPWQSANLSPQLNAFIRDTKAAALIRSQLHQLEEAILAGGDVDGQSVLGTVDWIDRRKPGVIVRYAVSCGSNQEAEWLTIPAEFHPDAAADVAEFRLTVAGQQTDMDALRETIRRFSNVVEVAVAASVREAVLAEAKKRNAPLRQLCASAMADTTVATRFEQKPGQTNLTRASSQVSAEVLANSFGIAE